MNISLEFWYPWSRDLGWEVQRLETWRITQVAPDNQRRNNQKKWWRPFDKKTWDYGFPEIPNIRNPSLVFFFNIYLSCIGVLGPDTIWQPSAGTWIFVVAILEDMAHRLRCARWKMVEEYGHCKFCTLLCLQNAVFFFGIRPASMVIELLMELRRHDSCWMMQWHNCRDVQKWLNQQKLDIMKWTLNLVVNHHHIGQLGNWYH